MSCRRYIHSLAIGEWQLLCIHYITQQYFGTHCCQYCTPPYSIGVSVVFRHMQTSSSACAAAAGAQDAEEGGVRSEQQRRRRQRVVPGRRVAMALRGWGARDDGGESSLDGRAVHLRHGSAQSSYSHTKV